MAETDQLVIFVGLIVSYVALLLYLISLVAFSATPIVANVFLGLLCGSLFLAAASFEIKHPRGTFWHRRGRRRPTLWMIYRPRKTERIEKIVAAVLWALILLLILGMWLRFRSTAF